MRPLSNSVHSAQSCVLTKPIAAVEQMTDENGKLKAGRVRQLIPGQSVVVSGSGFSEKTIRVEYAGKLYFVFLEDLQALSR